MAYLPVPALWKACSINYSEIECLGGKTIVKNLLAQILHITFSYCNDIPRGRGLVQLNCLWACPEKIRVGLHVSTQVCHNTASEALDPILNALSDHRSNLWPYTGNWAINRRWVFFWGWALFDTMVQNTGHVTVRKSDSMRGHLSCSLAKSRHRCWTTHCQKFQ